MEYHIQLDQHGRMLIPANIRKSLNYQSGDHLILRTINNEIHILKIDQVVKEAHELIEKYLEPGESLLEELFQMRKEEFKKEEEKINYFSKENNQIDGNNENNENKKIMPDNINE